jgi:hypothetical protein
VCRLCTLKAVLKVTRIDDYKIKNVTKNKGERRRNEKRLFLQATKTYTTWSVDLKCREGEERVDSNLSRHFTIGDVDYVSVD